MTRVLEDTAPAHAPAPPAAETSEAPAPDREPGRLRRLAASRRAQTVAATLAYAAFTLILTWPLVIDLNTRIYGAAGDLTGGMATFREYVDNGQLPFLPGTIGDFNAPEGQAVRWTLNIATFSSVLPLYLLTLAFGELPGFALFMLLGFVASGVAMFLLVRRLLGHAGVAFFAGFVYAFYPFVVIKAQGHIAFVHGWVLVVALWRLIELMDNPTRRNGVWAGLAMVLAFAWSPYHILFTAVIALALGVVACLYAWRGKVLRPTLTAFAIAGLIGLGWLGAMRVLDTAAPRSEVRAHTVNEAIAFSARAEEYVIPTPEHPIVGDRAGEYRLDHLHGSNFTENMLYVGISVLILALVGLVAAARDAPRRRIAAIALALAVFGVAFSAPPRVDLAGVNIVTPTEVMFDVTTTWRVFSRMVVVVMLGLAILAAIGVLAIVRRRGPAVQAALVGLLLVVVGADLWARPPQPTNKINVPPTYSRLAELPPGAAAEYPLLPAEQSSYGDVFYQGWHDHPILNGYFEGSPDEFRTVRIRDLSKRATARALKALGIRYVLVRQDRKQASLPNPGRPGKDFRFITRDPYIALYEVVPPGVQAFVTPMEGFALSEEGRHGRFQWMLEPEGTIDVRASCSPCAGTVQLYVGSFDQPRDVTVTGPGGRVLARARVSDPKRLRFPVSFDRKLTLRIRSTPGPQSIHATNGSADPRSISLSVERERFEPERAPVR